MHGIVHVFVDRKKIKSKSHRAERERHIGNVLLHCYAFKRPLKERYYQIASNVRYTILTRAVRITSCVRCGPRPIVQNSSRKRRFVSPEREGRTDTNPVVASVSHCNAVWSVDTTTYNIIRFVLKSNVATTETTTVIVYSRHDLNRNSLFDGKTVFSANRRSLNIRTTRVLRTNVLR